MNFSYALNYIKQGKRVQRAGWNGKGMWIGVQYPNMSSKMTLPYIYMYTADKNLVPWIASQTDLFAEDWEELK